MNPLLSALVAAGIITQDDADRINRQLDPTAARAWAEQQLAVAMQAGLSDQQARLIEAVRRNGGTLSAAQIDAFWTAEDDRLWEVLRPTWEQVAAENAVAFAVNAGMNGALWNTVNERMLSWVNDYYVNPDAAMFGSIPNLNLTSRTEFARAFTEWQRGELEASTRRGGLPQLIEAITPTFGPDRARVIAATEGTRILQGAGQAAADASDNLQVAIYQTAADERVCPVCGPNHMHQRRKQDDRYPNGSEPPPLHPNCRCREVFVTQVVADLPAPPEETFVFSMEEYQTAQRDARTRTTRR
jgi:hypothetical protein